MRMQLWRKLLVCCGVAVVSWGQFTSRAGAQYDPPTPEALPGEEPGPWPTTVSGANINVEMSPGSILGGGGSDTLKVTLNGHGPIKWSQSRHNEGDIAMVIGMQENFDTDPPNEFIDNYAITEGATTWGWRVNHQIGMPLATVRANGRNNQDAFNLDLLGDPVGTFYASGHFNQGFAQGWSYSMIDGFYSNGGDGAADLVMGYVGPPDEANIDMGLAFFPYSQGWIGGIVDGDNVGANGDSVWAGTSYNVNQLADPPPVAWASVDEAKARLVLPGGLGPDTGMLFVDSADSGSQLRLASAYPRDRGWDIAIREDDNVDLTGQTLVIPNGGDGDADFMFLYVDYRSTNLVGGHVNGADGSVITGSDGFTLTRSTEGQYNLSISGKTDSDGMLILSNAGLQPGTSDLADRSFLSYEYDSGLGNFIIQSREFAPAAGATYEPDDPSTWDWPLNDTDFYFAWVDFSNPLAPPAKLQAGDADQDFDFDQLDLVQVQIAAKYLTGQPATWGEGDWNGAPGGEPGSPPAGDGEFNQVDIIGALSAGLYLTGPYAAIGSSGQTGDSQTSIIYNANTGELGVDAPAGTDLTSINIDSAAGVFTGDAAANLGGSFDNDADNNIFKATFGSSFGSVSFGNVAQTGLPEDFVLNDLTVVGSLQGGGGLGVVDLIYVPEPCGALLVAIGVIILASATRPSPWKSAWPT